MVHRITWAVCFLASAITLMLACTSTAGFGPRDVVIVAFILGPYLLLGLLAWWQRGESLVSWLLLTVTFLLATWGVYLFGLDSYRSQTEWEYRMAQRLTVFLVPLLQWAAVLVVGLVLLGHWAITRNDVPVSRG